MLAVQLERVVREALKVPEAVGGSPAASSDAQQRDGQIQFVEAIIEYYDAIDESCDFRVAKLTELQASHPEAILEALTAGPSFNSTFDKALRDVHRRERKLVQRHVAGGRNETGKPPRRSSGRSTYLRCRLRTLDEKGISITAKAKRTLSKYYPACLALNADFIPLTLEEVIQSSDSLCKLHVEDELYLLEEERTQLETYMQQQCRNLDETLKRNVQ
ncbi:hypothetical protein BCR43DRAFT_514501 [Syncephalastrum racemosum]|uniref:Uncharacterized protein n=1 Tax=Syncephalastrum racemosum TaxID=13706 RepID=A0A1X2HGY8_SYNRA|nr:hypothetical protein BCR43DRAFT_514501 [Syncephalastrum racemosum]